MKKAIRITFFSVLGLLAILVLFFALEYNATAIPGSECKIVTGNALSIAEGGIKDVVFSIEGNNERFYINRGLESKYSLGQLKSELLGKNVTIRYSAHESLFFGANSVHHIRSLHVGDTMFYSEF